MHPPRKEEKLSFVTGKLKRHAQPLTISGELRESEDLETDQRVGFYSEGLLFIPEIGNPTAPACHGRSAGKWSPITCTKACPGGGGSGLAAESRETGVCGCWGARPLLPRPAALSAGDQLLYKDWRAQDCNILDTSIRKGNLA